MKKQVIQLAQALYPNSLVEVTGGRKRHNGGKKPHFIVQVNVDGLVLAMNNEDNRGWTRVLTPNGKLGFIHRNNLKRVK